MTDGPDALLAIAPLAPLILLFLARKRFQIVPLSPVWLIAIIVAVVGSLGYLLADQLNGLGGGGMKMILQPQDHEPTVLIFAASVLAFCVGAIVAAMLAPRQKRLQLGAVEVSRAGRTWMLVVALVPIVMILASLGSTLFFRDVYLAGAASKAVFGLGQQLATATFALVGYVVAAGTKPQRFVAVLIAAGYVAVFFSLGSRRLALLPLVFVIGILMAKPTRIWLKLIIAGAVAAVILPIPLFFRQQTEHGLFAYASTIGAYDLENVDWLTTINNVLISFPTTAMTALHVQPLPIDYLWISLNPLPGEWVGWYQIAPTMTLNAWTPFSAVGELWNYGALVAVFVWAAIGVIAAWLDRVVRRLWEQRLPFVGLAVIGLSALFALQALQYNVRSSSRMLLYAVGIAIIALIYVKLREGRRASREAAALRAERAREAYVARTLTPSMQPR